MDLSAEELLDRKNTLKEFENFFDDATDALKNIVEKIGWNLDETSSNEPLVKCPFNNEHRLLPAKLEDHCEACQLKQNGYDSTHSLYPSYNLSTSAQTIKIDKTTQMNILKSAYEESNCTLKIKLEPREVSQSIERYVCDFTPDERRVLYDSAVKNTKLPSHDFVKNDLLGFDVFNKTVEKPKTELELLQEQRDSKRRRAAYRGKRVHTDRKSYVEVLREVVEGLTSSLTQKDCKSLSTETSNSIPEIISNNRLVYKYEGNQTYDGNPYTRWLNIKVEESKLVKRYEEKSTLSLNSMEIQLSKDNTDNKKPKRSRSRSKETRRSISEEQFKRSSRRSRSQSKFNSRKYMNSKRSSSPLMLKETNSKRPKTRTNSKEMLYRRSRNRSISSEHHHKASKRHIIHSNSKETLRRRSRSKSMSVEHKHKKTKRLRSRSTSNEYGSRKKLKYFKSPTNCYKASQSSEKDITLKSKSKKEHKKKNKHKKSKKHSKSPKRSYKSKKNSDIEVSENFDGKISNDNNISSTRHQQL